MTEAQGSPCSVDRPEMAMAGEVLAGWAAPGRAADARGGAVPSARPLAGVLAGDPGLLLLCDGRAMVAERPGVGQWRVTVPAGARELRLESRAVWPVLALGGGGIRRLGVLVQRIAVEQGGRAGSLALDDPGLARGFHPAERVDGHLCRWTDGAGVIPLHLLGDPAAAMVVTLRCFLLPPGLA